MNKRSEPGAVERVAGTALFGLCRDCKHWGEDATQITYSMDMRICHGLPQEVEDRPDGKGWKYKAKSAVVERVELYDDHIDPRFSTGPDFGCVNFEPNAKVEVASNEH